MENINTSNTSDFETILEEMNKNLFNNELADIFEVTYAYADLWDWRFLNKTLFWTFLANEYDWKNKNEEKEFWKNIWENIKSIYGETLVKLTFKSQQVGRYKRELLSLKQENNPKIKILLWSLDYLDKILDLTITWLLFEVEKAWLNHNLNQKEIENKVKKLEEIEKELFGWNIRKNKKEVEWSYKELVTLFESKKDILTLEEKQRFNKYISILRERFSLSIQNGRNTKEDLKISDSLNREIQREDYVKIFQIVIDIYWLDKIVKIEERNSIYDWEYLGIPNNEAYKTLKLQKILEFIQHEIETHYIIEQNNKQTLWNFRWAWNLQREEWLAITSEWFLKWKTLDNIWIWKLIPDLLMWEILPWKEYKDFLIILSKLNWTENAFWVFLRRKRNYPLNYSWVQHKDTSYNRVQNQIVNFIKNDWNIKDLYVWKVSFEDIPLTKEIIEKWNIKLLYPLLIWELLQYVILWNKLHENDFWNYIEQKYPFLNIREEIANKSIDRLSFPIKRQIIQILQLLK